MKKSVTFIAAFAIALFLVFEIDAQDLKIKDIKDSSTSYLKESVTISGLVEQYIENGNRSTNEYLLKDDFGGDIVVNTSDGLPETNKKYRVTGTIASDPDRKDIYLIEKYRVMLDIIIVEDSTEDSGKEIIVDNRTAIQKYFDNLIDAKDTSTILITALVLVLIVLIIVFVLRKKKEAEPEHQYFPQNEPAPVQKQEPVRHQEFKRDEPQEFDDFKTIKINKSADPKTLVFIPGTLTIISGADAGKSFRIAGYPTPAGSIVSIGREQINGDRQYSHIQLMEQTVSRKQAEIISKNGKLSVKNLSETNLTVVDGVELSAGQSTELRPNSTIRTGEVEFKYTV